VLPFHAILAFCNNSAAFKVVFEMTLNYQRCCTVNKARKRRKEKEKYHFLMIPNNFS